MHKKNGKKSWFIVSYQHGLHSPVKVEAYDVEDATKHGLAAYRKDYGFVEAIHDWPAERIVDKVTPVL